MLKEYPFYKVNRKKPEAERAYSLLSAKNKEAIEKHIRECSIKSKAKKRIDNRKRALIRFFSFINKDFDKITYEDYVNVAEAISNSKLGVYARNGEVDFIKRFLREHYSDWAIKFKQFKLFASEQKAENEKLTPEMLLTDIEIEKLIKATSNMKYKALICVLGESGGRPEEILKTRWCDVDFNKGLIYLFSAKTKRKRAVPIKASITHLQRLKEEIEAEDSDYIFYSTRKDKKLCAASLNLILNNLAEKASINKRVFPYLFRHTRLSLLITKLSPKVYEDISGHSLQMGMKTYAHLSKDKLIQEMNEKVFEAKELTPAQKTQLERALTRIEVLEQGNKEIQNIKQLVNILTLSNYANQLDDEVLKRYGINPQEAKKPRTKSLINPEIAKKILELEKNTLST